jgi:histidine ammonia-lyase
MRLKTGFGKREKIVIKHVDLDELNLIVDGEKLTEARAAAMGEELAKEAHRILRLRQQDGDPKHQQ